MEYKKKKIIEKIPQLIYIKNDKSNSMKTKKVKFSQDIIAKKRSNSVRDTFKRNKVIYFEPIKRIWKNMKIKFKKTTKQPKDFVELKEFVKKNGLDEKLNYDYLKYLKQNKNKNFLEEFEQYKYTLSPDKRIDLSENPKEEINVSLKNYFENILLSIVNEPDKFDADKELKKFKIDFEKFGILINPNTNNELFYCLMLCKFLNVYNNLKIEDYEPDYYISLLKDFIEQKDLTPIKCLIIVWIILIIEIEDNDYNFYNHLKIYNSLLKKSENNEFIYEGKITKKTFIYYYQKINDDNKTFIEHSYFGSHFKYIYNFFKDVIRSPLLNQINSSIEGYSSVLHNYDYSDVNEDKIILFPMFLTKSYYGLTQNYLDIVLINSLPFTKCIKLNSPDNVVIKIHNYFCLYSSLLHEQCFHYLRLVFNKLDSDIDKNTPKNLFSNLTKNIHKLKLLNEECKDAGDKGEIIIFGKNSLNLKQILYFCNIDNYNKLLSQIEKEISDLSNIDDIVEEDINNSFLRDILTEEEKDCLYKGKYDKKLARHLIIKTRKNTGTRFIIPFFYGKDKSGLKKP